MLTCNKIMSTREIIMLTRNLNCVACQHVLLVDINKSHVDIILWHVNMIYRACSWQKYYTIAFTIAEKIQLYLNTIF